MAQRKPKKPKKPVKASKLEPVVGANTKPGRPAESKAPSRKRQPPPAFDEEPAAATENQATDASRFPVVVIGASAGGLAAMEVFFEHLPRDSGMAFVVVTHQSPDHNSLLPELIGRYTDMQPQAVVSGVSIAPNHVYVTPPGHWLVFRGDELHLQAFDEQRGGPLPIDAAFRSLAHVHAERGVAIVLSGNGSDGSLGLTEVKSAYGMVMTQDPQTAQCTGMPGSAIATHMVDFVLAPSQMPGQLVRYVRNHLPAHRQGFELDKPSSDDTLQRILAVLRSRTGNDFSAYKKSTIRRRIERRMHVHSISSADEYAHFLEHTAYEVDALFRELLISVTSFFRDEQAYEVLDHELTKLIELKTDTQPLRAWVAGCATGEEAYSIAIVLKEVLLRSGKELKIQIFATDLDQHAVDVARSGRYPEGIAADVSPERLKRYFSREDSGYRVNKDVREVIIFAVQNVIKDPPFTKLDLLSCRNLLIYLESSLQKRVLSLFSYSLRTNGVLLLGTSESVSGFDDRFSALDKRWKLFQRLPTTNALSLPEFFAERSPSLGVDHSHALARDGQRPLHGIAGVAERVLLANFVPPSVIISERGEMIYVQGRIGMFFEPAQGEPRQNVFSMAREGLRSELPAAVRKAATSVQPVVRPGLLVKTNGNFTAVTMSVRRLTEPAALRGSFLISFEDSSPQEAAPKRPTKKHSTGSPERITVLEDELQRTRENLQGMIEELETSNEELKSTNEELQSTNEELQSTNEELETSREEMQSLNEELQTVNTELEERNRALSQANDDMQNLLNSTEVATVFLDDKLHIKRFTTQARKVFSLIDTDIGRPITDLAINLRYDGLLSDAQDVLGTLVFREREIQTKEGAWRLMRIMPYRTHENLIDGLVITLVDIDRLKRAQRSALQIRLYTDEFLDAIKTGILVLDAELRVVVVNRAFCAMFGLAGATPIGQPLETLARNAQSLPVLDGLCDQLLSSDSEPEQTISNVRLTAAGHEGAVVSAIARRLPSHSEQPAEVLLMFDAPKVQSI